MHPHSSRAMFDGGLARSASQQCPAVSNLAVGRTYIKGWLSMWNSNMAWLWQPTLRPKIQAYVLDNYFRWEEASDNKLNGSEGLYHSFVSFLVSFPPPSDIFLVFAFFPWPLNHKTTPQQLIEWMSESGEIFHKSGNSSDLLRMTSLLQFWWGLGVQGRCEKDSRTDICL